MEPTEVNGPDIQDRETMLSLTGQGGEQRIYLSGEVGLVRYQSALKCVSFAIRVKGRATRRRG